MRRNTKRVFLLLTLAAVLFLSGESVLAQTFSGNMCFDMRITEDEDGPVNKAITAKMHAVALDQIQSTVSGVVQVPNDGLFVTTGMAIVQGKLIFINLTGTQTHLTEPWRDSAIMQIRLIATTMKGTFWTIGHDFNTADGIFDSTYASGTIAKVACK